MNLIICLTPLQMLIAENIINLFPSEKFNLVVIALSDNQKYRYYYNKVSKKVSKSIYFHEKFNFLSFLKFVFIFRIKGYCINYEKYFFASIDSRYIQYILSKVNNPVVYTFDDGTMNIYQDSIFYKKENIGLLKYLFWRVLGVRYFREELRLFSRLHYSIYPGVSNIANNIKYLKLFFNEGNDNSCENGREVNFFLGQPLDNFEKKMSYEAISHFISTYKIDYYFLHPREDTVIVESIINIPIIDSELIFEDFLSGFLIKYNISGVKLYSISSSTIFNLSSVSNIECFFVCNSFLYHKYKQMYDLASRRFGVVRICLDEEY